MPSTPDPIEPSPESLFARWLVENQSGAEPSLEALLREHPAHESRLRELQSQWESLEAVRQELGVRGTLTERLQSQFGSGVDPKVDLPGEEPGEHPFSAEVLARLSEHRPASTRYRLEGEVARGGMGAILRVWDEDLRRHLAMKVVLGKSGLGEEGDTPRIAPRMLARFLEEAQVTGQLDHPGIVPVHELGLDPEGRVFFTMKLVKGQTLREVLDQLAEGEGDWTRTRVLGLLLKVCEAMSYAHAKHVIHRDLKPGNVMIGRFGEVFVMDWGLAKILGRDDGKDIRIQPEPSRSTILTSDRKDRGDDTPDSPLYTMDGDVVGTPAYMSPEQALGSMDDMGPHSDVYAVGAMLYHLLVGHMPYVQPGTRASNYAVWRWVTEASPTPVEEKAPDAPPELHAICEKAMARDIGARYASMRELAADLSAYLEGRVVRAHETGAWAEAKKWVKRNKGLAASLLVALGAALTGLAGVSYVQAEGKEDLALANEDLEEALANEAEASDAARRQALTRKRVIDLLVGIFEKQQPKESRGATLTVKEVLDLEAATLATALDEEPHVKGRLLIAMGDLYASLGTQDEAAPLLEEAMSLLAELPGAREDLLLAQDRAGSLYRRMSQLERAEELLRSTLEERLDLLGPEHTDTIDSYNNLALLLQVQGNNEEAGECFRLAHEHSLALKGELDDQTLSVGNNLARFLERTGRIEEAEALFLEVIAGRIEASGEDHPSVATLRNNLAFVYRSQKRHAEAEALARAAHADARRIYGDDHPRTLTYLSNVALHLMDQKRYDEAEPLRVEVLERSRTVLGENNLKTAFNAGELGYLYRKMKRFEDALPHYEAAIAAYSAVYSPDHGETLSALYGLGIAQRDAGRLEQALATLTRTRTGMEVAFGPSHWHTLDAMASIAKVHEAAGDLDRAVAQTREALARAREAEEPGGKRTLRYTGRLADLLVATGSPDEAQALLEALATELPEGELPEPLRARLNELRER